MILAKFNKKMSAWEHFQGSIAMWNLIMGLTQQDFLALFIAGLIFLTM